MPRKRRDSMSTEDDSDSNSSDDTDEFEHQRGREDGKIKKYNRKHGERTKVGKSNTAKHGSSYLRLTTQGVDQFASTPKSILGELTARYGPPLGWNKPLFDPCPEIYNKGKRVNSPDFDGLTQDWGRVSYVNPPYGQIKKWFPQAIAQQKLGNTSVFLLPLRPFTKYFLATMKSISWIEVIYYGVGFKGYAGKIPHPMCTIVFLGKGVKNLPAFHRTQATNKKHHTFTGQLPVRVPARKYTYVQDLSDTEKAFNDATQICVDNGIPKARIYIMINSSNMTNAGYLDDDRIAAARKSWKNAYALLVPFYNYSCAFQKGMRETSILAYSSPILSNYAGEGKCRFCSVLFVFCPTKDARFKKFISDDKLHPFKMHFNYNGYLPTVEELQAAKMKKIQSTKAEHMKKQRGVPNHRALKKSKKTSAKKTSAKKKPKKTSAKKKKKPAKKPRATAKTTPRKKKAPKKSLVGADTSERCEAAYKCTRTYAIMHKKLPSKKVIQAQFQISITQAKKVIKDLLSFLANKQTKMVEASKARRATLRKRKGVLESPPNRKNSKKKARVECSNDAAIALAMAQNMEE